MASFVKRAPEIAEELLLKAGGFTPDALKKFSKDLLSKEASGQGESLEIPKRMTLADLQKSAAPKAELPKVSGVKVEDWQKIASDLSKLAERSEEENARDIFETAAALVMKKQAASASVSLTAGRTPRPMAPKPKMFSSTGDVPLAQPQGALKRMFSEPARREHEMYRAQHGAQMAKIPGTREHAQVEGTKALKEEARSHSEAQKGRHDLASHAIATAPMAAMAVGTPLAAAALLKSKDDKKKEEVKIYK